MLNAQRSTVFVLTLFISLLTGCGSGRVPVPPGEIPAPITPSAEEIAEGRAFRDEILREAPLETSPKYVKRVQKVIEKLLVTAGSNEEWNIYVLRSPEWNAFTTPGNNIYVYTGLLDETKNDDELAVVLAHELAHNLARHVVETDEEKGNQLLATLAGVAVTVALEANSPGSYGNDSAGELTTSMLEGFIVNPYSQKLEHEADHIGLFLMAEAGYDPTKALSLWERQAAAGGEPPKFFSTHPPSVERKESLESLMPAALERRASAAAKPNQNQRGEPAVKTPTKLPASLQREFERGNAAFQTYDYPTAIKAYKSVLHKAPGHIDSRLNLAIAHFKLGDAPKAESELRRALRDDPTSALAHYNLACVLASTDRNDEAFPQLEKALAADPRLYETAKSDPDLAEVRKERRFGEIRVQSPSSTAWMPNSTTRSVRRARGSPRVRINVS